VGYRNQLYGILPMLPSCRGNESLGFNLLSQPDQSRNLICGSVTCDVVDLRGFCKNDLSYWNLENWSLHVSPYSFCHRDFPHTPKRVVGSKITANDVQKGNVSQNTPKTHRVVRKRCVSAMTLWFWNCSAGGGMFTFTVRSASRTARVVATIQ
jgi:hypothetical protein